MKRAYSVLVIKAVSEDARQIEGIATTIPFHKRVLENEVFLAGEATTDFIETQMGDVL